MKVTLSGLETEDSFLQEVGEWVLEDTEGHGQEVLVAKPTKG